MDDYKIRLEARMLKPGLKFYSFDQPFTEYEVEQIIDKNSITLIGWPTIYDAGVLVSQTLFISPSSYPEIRKNMWINISESSHKCYISNVQTANKIAELKTDSGINNFDFEFLTMLALMYGYGYDDNEPKNNDGRQTCWWCGSQTRHDPGWSPGSSGYDVCINKGCEK